MYSFQGQFLPLEFNLCWLKTIFYMNKLDKQILSMTSFSNFKIRGVSHSEIMPKVPASYFILKYDICTKQFY